MIEALLHYIVIVISIIIALIFITLYDKYGHTSELLCAFNWLICAAINFIGVLP